MHGEFCKSIGKELQNQLASELAAKQQNQQIGNYGMRMYKTNTDYFQSFRKIITFVMFWIHINILRRASASEQQPSCMRNSLRRPIHSMRNGALQAEKK